MTLCEQVYAIQKVTNVSHCSSKWGTGSAIKCTPYLPRRYSLCYGQKHSLFVLCV